jgi:peptidyl-prolyl cis-trans isomerase D
MFTQATKFEIEATEKDFNVVAKEMGLTVVPGISVSAMDENFGPLGNQRSIVRWSLKMILVGSKKDLKLMLGMLLQELKI